MDLDKSYRLEQLINEFFEITRFNLQSIPLNRENLHLSYMFQDIFTFVELKLQKAHFRREGDKLP